MKKIGLTGSSLVLLLFYFVSCQTTLPEFTWGGSTMGTTYQIKVTAIQFTDQEYKALQREIDAALREVNRQMSTYDPQSEISRFNEYSGTDAFSVSRDFVKVVKLAQEVSVKSAGAFDITVAPLVDLWGFGKKGRRIDTPSEAEIEEILRRVGYKNLHVYGDTLLKKDIPDLQLDLSAIAKGYGVDVVALILTQKDYPNYLVEIGGEVRAQGINARRELWKVGVDRPEYANIPGQNLQGVLALDNVSVATSGDYRNYIEIHGEIFSHTIDPKIGRPVRHNLASTTVIAEECVFADALATAVMALGLDAGLQLIEDTPGVEALLILRLDDGEFIERPSSGFNRYIYKNP